MNWWEFAQFPLLWARNRYFACHSVYVQSHVSDYRVFICKTEGWEPQPVLERWYHLLWRDLSQALCCSYYELLGGICSVRKPTHYRTSISCRFHLSNVFRCWTTCLGHITLSPYNLVFLSGISESIQPFIQCLWLMTDCLPTFFSFASEEIVKKKKDNICRNYF